MFTEHLSVEETRQSLIEGLGFDYDGVTPPEVAIHSLHWHDCNLNGTVCDVVLTAWGDPIPFKARWNTIDGWWFEGDDVPHCID